MFKLESFVTPLLANYLNKYIKDLKADDLQLSLWKGEAVLNNLDLRLDAIEHDLGLPFTFVSGNIQELRIKVPWTRLTTEPVVISVNTMECVVQLSSPTRPESPMDWEHFDLASKSKVGPVTSPSTVPPPPGYMESLSMRVLNNVRIQFTNLILRYMEDDFIATVLVKNADYYTVNGRWEKSFVEVSQPDFCLRRVLAFHDLHISFNAKNSTDTKTSFPLVERTFVTCRFLTKFDGSDCRGILATVFNVLSDEVHVSVTDQQLPMVRRLVDLAIAFQAGVLNSRLKRDAPVELVAVGDGQDADLFAEPLVEQPAVLPVQASNSWTSWALSLIPVIPSDSDGDTGMEVVEQAKKSLPALPKASSFAAYVRKLTLAFAMTDIANAGKAGRLARRPILRLEIENALLSTKSREAKFNSFRAAIGMCQLVAVNECPCGESATANAESSRAILSFSESENPLSERSKLLSGSLFGTTDDEKESMDAKAPFDSLDSYLTNNSETDLLKSYGVIVADSASVIEPPDDFTGVLSKMSENDLAQSNLKQGSCFRIVVSPLMLFVDSAAFHRYQHFTRWFNNYTYLPYDLSAGQTRSPSPTLQLPSIIPAHVAMKTLHISFIKPTVVLVAPSHPSLQVGLTRRKVKSSTLPTDLPSVILQAERFDFRQSAPFYPDRLLDAAEQAAGVGGETLKRNCVIQWSFKLSSAEVILGILMPHHPPFRDVRTLISPAFIEYGHSQPVDKNRCYRLWGQEECSTVTCAGAQLVASLPELLLSHFCVSGLLQDVGSFVAHRTFQTLAESVFDKNIRDDNLIRIDLRCGKVFAKITTKGTSTVLKSRLLSLELSLLIGDSSETLLSTVLRDRVTGPKNVPPDHGVTPRSGSMRISAYNVGLQHVSDLESNAVKYSLHFSTTTKLTIYPDFINRFIENLGVSVQYQRDFSNASLYREMSVAPPTKRPLEPPPSAFPNLTFEVHHEKLSLDVLDELFDYLTVCIHSGMLRLSSEHANITSYVYNTRAVLINLGRVCREPCIGPVSGRFQFEAFGSGDSVASFITGDVSLLPLRIGALTMTSLDKVTREILEAFKSLKNSLADQHSSEKPNRRVPPSLKVVAREDDLRTQNWDYYTCAATERSDQIPNVNQIRFCENSTNQTMTWRYPELRTISSAAIIPMPFQISASGNDARQEVICSLQYLKRPMNTFVDLRSFTLMESKECIFRFPEVVPEDFDRVAISDVWRVRVSYGTQEESMKPFPVSVLSLAGCMKINSGIIVGVPSCLHFSLNLGVVSLGLIHRVPVLAKTPGHSLISGFTYDSSYPSDQEFGRVKLDKVSLSTRIMGDEDSSKITVESSFWLECDFVNYRFLTVQPLVEACSFTCSFSYITEDKIFIQAKLDSKTPLVLHCGQNAIHSLSMGYLAWKMAQTGEYPSLPIMNHIVVCNDTYHVVRIRQYTTDECIYIKPKEMHPYSWRSQRADLKLQFSVETYPNLWSEACPVDLGSKLCSFPTAEDLELGLVCTVRALNNIQKQVVLSTQFVVSNQLNFDIEVQLYTEPDYVSNPLIEMAQEPIAFHAGVASSTRCVPVEKIKRYRLRRKAGIWSESVAMTAKSEHMIVRLPVVSGSALDIWSSLTFPVAPSGSRLLVFSSILCGKNHLPYPVQIELESGSLRVQENLVAHGTAHFALSSYTKDDCTVRISRIGSTKVPQVLSVNLAAVLSSMPPRTFVRSSSDLVGDTNLAAVVKKRRNSEPASAAVMTAEYLVEFERQTNYTDTLVLHVKPNGIRIISDYDRDLLLYGEDEELITAVPAKGSSVLPISVKGQIRLGTQNSGTVYLSDSFDVKQSQTAREPMMDCTGMGVLLTGGFIVVTFWEKLESQFLIHHLTLRLSEDDSVYTLRITSRFSALYASDDMDSVVLAVFVAPKLHSKMDYVAALKPSTHHALSGSSRSAALSPFVYLVPPNHPIELDPNRATDLLTYVCISSATAPEPQWSFPRQIKEVKTKKSRVVKLNAPLPVGQLAAGDGEAAASLLCYKITAVEDLGVCQLLIELGDAPNLIFRNNCPYPLTFGECVRKGPGFVTFEEKESFIPLPVVEPGSLATYSYPSRDEEFPRVTTTAVNYLLRIGRIIQTGSASQQTVVWSSSSVDAYTATNDRFVSIPGMCYLKLHFERQNRRTVRILIDPLSRVATPLQTPPALQRESFFPLPESVVGDVASSSTSLSVSPVIGETPGIALNVGVSCVLKSVILTVDDEISNPAVVAEVLRLSVDDISVQFYCDGQTTRTYECAVNVNDLQLDNQLYSCGFFDFPVVLTKENPTKNVQSVLNILCRLNSETLAPENIHVSVAPMACFVEDTLAFHLLRLTDTYLVPALLVVQTPVKIGSPANDMEHARRLLRTVIPVVIERIHIAPVEVYLSVHAALKLFVGLNQTPLSFSEIDCNDVNSTVAEVTNFIVQHYVRGTLLQAGWVIGSMDLLGNPASLLRSLTSGCGDLFVRPFSSLHAGPVSFLQGLAKGASSCLSGISAGTIMSVTNLAESVSRNLDWVSLDNDHVQRRMEVKYRQHPDGLGSGLKQGLTGFGMSLLGAVAGLIDQPMQAVLQPSLSPSQYVTALMLGITKGLVGAMSKPIAGAAGLVSQTGQGILRGHGMLNFPPRRYVALPKSASGFSESTLKYIWKVAPLLPNTVRTLCVVEATPVAKSPENSSIEPVCLFLTDSALFVISSADDEFRQAYSLSKLNIRLAKPPPIHNVHSHSDLIQVTLLIEADTAVSDASDETVWPWDAVQDRAPIVISSSQTGPGSNTHFTKESFLLEWKEAKLFEELFLVAKSNV